MVIIRVLLTIKPEAKETFLAAVQTLREEINAVEGCSHYAYYEQADQPNTYLLYEEWESKVHFEAYLESAHFAHANELLGDLMAGAPQSAYYEGALMA